MLTLLFPPNFLKLKRNLYPFSINIFPIVCLLLLSLCHSVTGSAQSTISSVNSRIQKAVNDKERLKIYKDVVRNNELEQADSLIKLLESGIQLFDKHNYDEGKADLQLSLGYVCSGRRLLDLAEEQLTQSLHYFEGVGNSIKIAEIHNLLGVVEGRRVKFEKAIKHFLLALDIFEKEKNPDGMASSFVKLGMANELSGNHSSAEAYYKKGLSVLAKDTLNPDYINLNNNLGTLYARLGKLDTSYVYFSQALRYCQGSRFIHLRILSQMNLANVLKEKANFALAEQYYNEALALAQKQNLPEEIIRVKINLAILASEKKDTKLALAIFNEALEIARQIEDKKFESEILNGIVEEYKVQGRFEEALALNERRETIDDSLFDLDKAAEIASLEVGYELSKTNARLAELKSSEERILKQRNITRGIAILLGFSFFILLFFFWKLIQLNRKLRLHEKELQKANHTKDRLFSIIGHDLRNPINNILMVLEMIMLKKYELEEEEEILGQLREDSITTLQTLDNLLKWGTSQLNGVDTFPRLFFSAEIVSSEFRQLQNIAAHKGIITLNEVPKDTQVYMDQEHFKFIVRNLIFNAIKFTPAGGTIKFSSQLNKNGYQVFSVSDNGVGVSATRKAAMFQQFGGSELGTDNEKGNGFGLMLCQLFVQQNGGQIWVEDNPEGKGSVFFFSVKSMN